MSLKANINKFFDSSIRMCESTGIAQQLSAELINMRKRLTAPLRVAVVGIMKAGKSTFLNAIMGEKIVYTGNLETTYTVCWFKYDTKPHITICFRDGSEINVPFSELEKWSVRASDKNNPDIDNVKYLVIYYPAPILKNIEFIDTPGLNSVYGTDAQNTLDFMALRSSEDTLNEASEADAVIYAFSRSAGGFDKEILDFFNKGKNESASPINSLGILTKSDSSGIWDLFDVKSPVESAEEVASTIRSKSEIKKSLFTVMPVCAKASEGFSSIGDKEFDVLKKLSEIDTDEVKDLLYDASEFASGCDECLKKIGSSDARSHLIHTVSQYGILEIVSALKKGMKGNEIKQIIDEHSGITAVKEVLNNHFGNRAFLIKVRYIFNRLSMILSRIPNENDELTVLYRRIREDLEDVISSLYVMDELKVLQMYYNGEIEFENEDEISDFLEITSEYGNNIESKLGTDTYKSLEELEKIAFDKVVKWRIKSGEFMRSGSYNFTASVIARSYERIYSKLHELND